MQIYYLLTQKGGKKSMRKKLVSGLLAATMVASLMVGCGSEADTDATTEAKADATEATEEVTEGEVVEDAATMEAPSAEGRSDINVYLWDDDGQGKVEYVLSKMDSELADHIKIVNLGVGGTDQAYADAVNAGYDSEDQYPSVILSDAGFVKMFAGSENVAAIADTPITEEMYANAYAYTKELGSANGEWKALSWQATPGCLVYRADIAEEVLGTSDPDEVAAKVEGWDNFFAVADEMKEAGYKMVSGADEIKYAALNQRTQPWVSDDSALQLGDEVTTYLENAKKLYDGDYTNKANTWAETWAGSMAEGDVFCYFGCTWFLGTVEGNCTDDKANFGNWRICAAPVGYNWGGTFLMIGKDTPDMDLAAYFVYMMTCDEDVLYGLNADKGDFVNNKKVIDQLVADGVGERDILDGQNALEVFSSNAMTLTCTASDIDNDVIGAIDKASEAYNTGEYESADECVDYIKDTIKTTLDYITVE